MFIVKYRKFFYLLSGIIMLGSLAVFIGWGLRLGIDFKGGSLIEVNYPNGRPDVSVIEKQLSAEKRGAFSVRPTGTNGYIVRMETLDEAGRVAVTAGLSPDSKTRAEIKRFTSIGPVLGAEAARNSLYSIAFVILCIVLFITFAFRKVSEPVASWKYGLIAIFALIHDVLVPTGAFVLLGHFAGVEVDTLFVTALLVVLGFSIHDTIVVFDRVRENLRLAREYREKKSFEQIVGESINQTFVRSINTSLTTVLALIVLYFVGGEATRYFSLALLIGIVAGTYSSIFLGSPLLVTVEKWQKNK